MLGMATEASMSTTITRHNMFRAKLILLYSGKDKGNTDELVYYIRGHRSKFPITMYFYSPGIVFTLTNNVYPDEMPHYYVAFHLGLHCLSMYPLRGFQYTNTD